MFIPTSSVASVTRNITINPKFCKTPTNARQAAEPIRIHGFRVVEILDSTGLHSEQLRELYQQAQGERVWKYDPPSLVLNGIGKISHYHILAVLDGEQVVGTVRAILLQNANFVFGSCLVVDSEYRNKGLAIPLIMAAMSIADEDSQQLGNNGILGAVLGVDDNPAMFTFHAKWDVRFIHKDVLPFMMPSMDGTAPNERIFGIRYDDHSETANMNLPVEVMKKILGDLRDFELAIGYPADAVNRVYENLNDRLKKVSYLLALLTAEECRISFE